MRVCDLRCANKLVINKRSLDDCAILHNQPPFALFSALHVLALILEESIIELIVAQPVSQLALGMDLTLVLLSGRVLTSCRWPRLGTMRDCYLVSYILPINKFEMIGRAIQKNGLFAYWKD